MRNYTPELKPDQKNEILKSIKAIEDPDVIFNLLWSLLYLYVTATQEPLIRLLYQHGVSQQKIGDALGLTKAAISYRFPKEGRKK